MRRVDPIPDCPKVLDGDGSKGVDERTRAIAHFTAADWEAREKVKKTQFKFTAYKLAAVRKALNDAFHHKCAYCETYFGATQPVAVEHYRPKGAIRRAGRQASKPGYYWLAASWHNLLPSCTDCNSEREQDLLDDRSRVAGKANWFPLADERRRARRADKEEREEPLLLHPYDDDPAEHLEFAEGGVVRGASRKGTETIEKLGLNRTGLALRRELHLERIDKQLERIARAERLLAKHPGDADVDQMLQDEVAELDAFLAEDADYSEMARQYIARRRP